MSLLSRIVDAEKCRVQSCPGRRAPDALVCRDDLDELWAHRLDRQPDGTFTRRRRLQARDLTGQLASPAL